MKVGICGFGKMGRIRAKAIEEEGRFEISKIFDVHYDGDETYEKADSIDAIVNDPDIGVVIVCLPNNLNMSTTITALKSGKHVFCEKPPARNVGELKQVLEAE